MVTSYCPDALAAADLAFSSPVPLHTFYDLDTPVTLSRLESGEAVDYIGPRGFRDYDLVVSYTGGQALEQLRSRLGAPAAVPLYGHVDPDVHRPSPPIEHYRSDLSYIGTYADDRQQTLEALFIEPARRLPESRFCVAGAMYPDDFPWTDNIFFVRHLPPAEHPAFFSSSRLTLNVTRRAMAEMGYCPSGRLFEAAACGVPILTDSWEGLGTFFEPTSEILVAHGSEDAIGALQFPDAELASIARRARERTLDQHTSAVRARELETILEHARSLASERCATAEAGERAVCHTRGGMTGESSQPPESSAASNPSCTTRRMPSPGSDSHPPHHQNSERARKLRAVPRRHDHVGNHSSRGRGQPDPTPRLFEGTAARRKPLRWRN